MKEIYKCCTCEEETSLESQTSCGHFLCKECVPQLCTTACPICRSDPIESKYLTNEILENIRIKYGDMCTSICRNFPYVYDRYDSNGEEYESEDEKQDGYYEDYEDYEDYDYRGYDNVDHLINRMFSENPYFRTVTNAPPRVDNMILNFNNMILPSISMREFNFATLVQTNSQENIMIVPSISIRGFNFRRLVESNSQENNMVAQRMIVRLTCDSDYSSITSRYPYRYHAPNDEGWVDCNTLQIPARGIRLPIIHKSPTPSPIELLTNSYKIEYSEKKIKISKRVEKRIREQKYKINPQKNIYRKSISRLYNRRQ